MINAESLIEALIRLRFEVPAGRCKLSVGAPRLRPFPEIVKSPALCTVRNRLNAMPRKPLRPIFATTPFASLLSVRTKEPCGPALVVKRRFAASPQGMSALFLAPDGKLAGRGNPNCPNSPDEPCYLIR